jgi:hypothetical protein
MIDVTEQKNIKPVDICLDAVVQRIRGDDAILCASNNPNAGKAPEYLVLFLGKGDMCIATSCFPTGHSTPSFYTNESRMYDCPYRRLEK